MITNKNLVIFDNDGVIVDSESLSCGALNTLFQQEFGIDIGNDFSEVIGTSDRYAIEYYGSNFSLKIDDIDRLISLKQSIYLSSAGERLISFPYLLQVLEKCILNEIKMVVASSGSLQKIKFSLSQVNFNQFFSRIFSSEQVKRGKPEPDLFNLVAEQMGYTPNDCIIIEDSVNGIIAGKRAKMTVIGFTSTFNMEKLYNAGADHVIQSYSELLDLIS
ncbi:MAG: HAD family phosphatase [Candidatus Heimdallarchaeota archaeon]|nr:HAD family phosphatase [Candidatus Heimdallarchaeota archaeon]MDH5644838.1 HAD family phosphatase [Candidatus Heimdallarchaeota archaeon]